MGEEREALLSFERHMMRVLITSTQILSTFFVETCAATSANKREDGESLNKQRRVQAAVSCRVFALPLRATLEKQRKLCLIAGKIMSAQGVFCLLDISFHSLQRNPQLREGFVISRVFPRESSHVTLALRGQRSRQSAVFL